MGILNFLSQKKSKKSPEKIWENYAFTYFKKYDLATELRNLINGINDPENLRKHKLINLIETVPEAIIKKVGEIEKLIPEELVELSEEELNLEKTIQNLKDIGVFSEKVEDIKHIILHREDLVDDINKVVVHMKEALNLLAELLKIELSLISLIKKDPTNQEKGYNLFQLIINRERNLVKIFGSELEGKDFQKVIKLINATLTDSQIKIEKKRREREIVFEDDDKLKQRKNRLDKVVAYFNHVLAELGEDNDFEIFSTQIDTGNISGHRAKYGIFIRLKNNKLSDYLIMFFLNEDLDQRLRNDQIAQDYQLKGFEDKLKQGIRILKAVSK